MAVQESLSSTAISNCEVFPGQAAIQAIHEGIPP